MTSSPGYLLGVAAVGIAALLVLIIKIRLDPFVSLLLVSAIVAIAHKLAKVIYSILKTQQPYAELGATFLDKDDLQRTTNNLTRRLERLGYSVSLQLNAA